MNKSVYDVILENMMPDGCMPATFSIDNKEEETVRFAPGALDGVMIFHAGIKSDEKVVSKLAKQVIKLCGEKEISVFRRRGIERKIEEIVTKNHCLSVVDRVQEKIYQNGERINGKKLFDYGYKLAFEGSHIECVKLGIAFLGMFDTKDEELYKKLSQLGAYEELTLYVAVAFSNYENGNSLLFDLVKKVNGWGRIHIVERLDSTNDEIREWIFRHGCKNVIMDSYLGLQCAQKGDFIGVLRKEELEKEELDAACGLFCALADEGPVEGMSAYEHAREAVELLVKHLERCAESILHFGVVTDIKNWIEKSDCDNKEELIEICDRILKKNCVKDEVIRCIKEGSAWDVNRAVNLGNNLGMDNSLLIYEAIKRSPMEVNWQINNIKDKREYVEELVGLYEDALPLEAMATGATEVLFPKTYVKEFHVMDSVLNVLDVYPNLGERIVSSAIASPSTRGRNSACRVIESWLEEGKISEMIICRLKDAVQIEVDEKLKSRMKSIIKKAVE